MGFEPTKLYAEALKTPPFGRSGTDTNIIKLY